MITALSRALGVWTPIRFLSVLSVIGLGAIASPALAQATTYTFTGANYVTIANGASCTVGECALYTTGQHATVTLTLSAPLGLNLPLADRSTLITAFTFSDGVRSALGPSATTSLHGAEIATDGSGVPNAFRILVQRTPGPTYPVNTPSNPSARVSSIFLMKNSTSVIANIQCAARGAGPGATPGPGNCSSSGAADGGTSTASNALPTTVSIGAPAVAVPTLSEWAMILFASLLVGSAVFSLGVRRGFT